MKMNKQSNEKNVATLSIVFSITISCRRSAGMNRTNLSIRNRRKVLRTLTPLDVVATELTESFNE